jgi:hypothetical protein
MWKVIALMMSITTLACGARGVARTVLRRPYTMKDLTIPTKRLPAGCGLVPTPSVLLGGNRVQYGLWAGLPIPTNPWSGTDRIAIASIRERMDGPPSVPDGPPPAAREISRYRSQLANGVEEGYAAIYTPSVVVYALRFAATERPFYPPRTASNHRFEIGPFYTVVSGDGGQCSQAVEAYLKSLSR